MVPTLLHWPVEKIICLLLLLANPTINMESYLYSCLSSMPLEKRNITSHDISVHVATETQFNRGSTSRGGRPEPEKTTEHRLGH